MTTKRERLQAALVGEKADRVPVALWRHFPVDDQDPIALAEATLGFQAEYDFDFIKVTPSSSFCVRDWGVEDLWKGDPEGTRDYTRYVIDVPSDWARLRPLPAHRGSLAAQLRCLEYLKKKCGEEIPFIQTIFSPLSQAKHLAGEGRLLEHLRREPRSRPARPEGDCRDDRHVDPGRVQQRDLGSVLCRPAGVLSLDGS